MWYCKRILSACGAVALLATPAWAHASSSFHVHSEDMVLLLIVAGALGAALAFWRARSRAA